MTLATLATWVFIVIAGIVMVTVAAKSMRGSGSSLFWFLLVVVMIGAALLYASGALCNVPFLHCTYK